jgi:hypothetical protein
MATYIKGCSSCTENLQCAICEWYCATVQTWLEDPGNLPASINFYGTTLSLSGLAYGNTTNGVILEGTVWAVYIAGVRTTQPSLYSANISDNFNSTYTLTTISNGQTNVPNATVTLTRDGCVWVGNQTIGEKAWQFRLINHSPCFQDDLGWEVLGVVPESQIVDIFFAYKLDENSIPITQGTPTGSYDILGPAVITIS